MGRLDGRVAFVTGAGRGIGAATALRMAEEGARVALADVDTEGCQQVAAELSRLGSEGLVFHCSRAAQKYMVQQRYGRIVSLSSTAALGNRGQANYSTAKAGLQGLTRTLAIELGPFGITVNAIGPGFIDTEMTRSTARRRGLDPDAVIAEASKNIPVRRVGQPRDVANVICFLCSEEASFVSGQVIYVAGGPRS